MLVNEINFIVIVIVYLLKVNKSFEDIISRFGIDCFEY